MCVAENDYVKFPGIGGKTAIDLLGKVTATDLESVCKQLVNYYTASKMALGHWQKKTTDQPNREAMLMRLWYGLCGYASQKIITKNGTVGVFWQETQRFNVMFSEAQQLVSQMQGHGRTASADGTFNAQSATAVGKQCVAESPRASIQLAGASLPPVGDSPLLLFRQGRGNTAAKGGGRRRIVVTNEDEEQRGEGETNAVTKEEASPTLNEITNLERPKLTRLQKKAENGPPPGRHPHGWLHNCVNTRGNKQQMVSTALMANTRCPQQAAYITDQLETITEVLTNIHPDCMHIHDVGDRDRMQQLVNTGKVVCGRWKHGSELAEASKLVGEELKTLAEKEHRELQSMDKGQPELLWKQLTELQQGQQYVRLVEEMLGGHFITHNCSRVPIGWTTRTHRHVANTFVDAASGVKVLQVLCEALPIEACFNATKTGNGDFLMQYGQDNGHTVATIVIGPEAWMADFVVIPSNCLHTVRTPSPSGTNMCPTTVTDHAWMPQVVTVSTYWCPAGKEDLRKHWSWVRKLFEVLGKEEASMEMAIVRTIGGFVGLTKACQAGINTPLLGEMQRRGHWGANSPVWPWVTPATPSQLSLALLSHTQHAHHSHGWAMIGHLDLENKLDIPLYPRRLLQLWVCEWLCRQPLTRGPWLVGWDGVLTVEDVRRSVLPGTPGCQGTQAMWFNDRLLQAGVEMSNTFCKERDLPVYCFDSTYGQMLSQQFKKDPTKAPPLRGGKRRETWTNCSVLHFVLWHQTPEHNDPHYALVRVVQHIASQSPEGGGLPEATIIEGPYLQLIDCRTRHTQGVVAQLLAPIVWWWKGAFPLAWLQLRAQQREVQCVQFEGCVCTTAGCAHMQGDATSCGMLVLSALWKSCALALQQPLPSRADGTSWRKQWGPPSLAQKEYRFERWKCLCGLLTGIMPCSCASDGSCSLCGRGPNAAAQSWAPLEDVEKRVQEWMGNVMELPLTTGTVRKGDTANNTDDLEELGGSAQRGSGVPEWWNGRMMQWGVSVGAGGYGRVYKCKVGRKTVVAKLSPFDDSIGGATTAVKKRADLERAVLAKLGQAHPNILIAWPDEEQLGCSPPVDIRQPVEVLWMEYMEGGDLDAWLGKRRVALSRHQLTHYATAVIAGIQHMHAQGVHHRDIKPANVLLGQWDNKTKVFKRVKLADFNMSCMEPTSQQKCGTVGYMAPEVVNAHSTTTKYDCASADVWSYGALLHSLLFLQGPFGDSNGTSECEQEQQQGNPRKILRARCRATGRAGSDNTRPMQGLMDDCMQHNPRGRPAVCAVVGRVQKLTPLQPTTRPPVIPAIPTTGVEGNRSCTSLKLAQRKLCTQCKIGLSNACCRVHPPPELVMVTDCENMDRDSGGGKEVHDATASTTNPTHVSTVDAHAAGDNDGTLGPTAAMIPITEMLHMVGSKVQQVPRGDCLIEDLLSWLPLDGKCSKDQTTRVLDSYATLCQHVSEKNKLPMAFVGPQVAGALSSEQREEVGQSTAESKTVRQGDMAGTAPVSQHMTQATVMVVIACMGGADCAIVYLGRKPGKETVRVYKYCTPEGCQTELDADILAKIVEWTAGVWGVAPSAMQKKGGKHVQLCACTLPHTCTHQPRVEGEQVVHLCFRLRYFLLNGHKLGVKQLTNDQLKTEAECVGLELAVGAVMGDRWGATPKFLTSGTNDVGLRDAMYGSLYQTAMLHDMKSCEEAMPVEPVVRTSNVEGGVPSGQPLDEETQQLWEWLAEEEDAEHSMLLGGSTNPPSIADIANQGQSHLRGAEMAAKRRWNLEMSKVAKRPKTEGQGGHGPNNPLPPVSASEPPEEHGAQLQLQKAATELRDLQGQIQRAAASTGNMRWVELQGGETDKLHFITTLTPPIPRANLHPTARQLAALQHLSQTRGQDHRRPTGHQ